MYDPIMENEETNILPDRLAKAIKLRKTTAAQLARDSGVDKSTLSLILAGQRPNTPAYIVAKLARVLMVSVDYLLGITEDPEPKALDLGEMLMELTYVAKDLPNRRLHDLLLMARTFLADSAELKGNPELLMSNLLDMIEESGGSASRDQLIDLLNRDDGGDELEDDQEQDDPDHPGDDSA